MLVCQFTLFGQKWDNSIQDLLPDVFHTQNFFVVENHTSVDLHVIHMHAIILLHDYVMMKKACNIGNNHPRLGYIFIILRTMLVLLKVYHYLQMEYYMHGITNYV